MIKSYKLVLACLLAVLAGCAPKPQPLTPEQQAMKTEMMKRMMERFQGISSSVPQAVAQQHSRPEAERLSEAELLARVGFAPTLDNPINVKKTRDGFTVNGKRYFDPEGRIGVFAVNSMTGDATYLLKGRNGRFSVKYVNLASNDTPVVIATGQLDRGTLFVETVTGKKLSGKDAFNSSRGFVVYREGTGFLYTVGKGITSFAAPEGYHFTRYQKGDVESTGYILVERDKVAADKLSSFLEAASDLGGTLGVSEKQDYALMNVHTGKIIALNIGYNRAAADAGIFDRDGYPNRSHVFWRVDWFAGKHGVYALYAPNASKKRAIALTTGKEKVLFDSLVGSVGWDIHYSNGGKITVSERRQFGDGEVIQDFESFMGS